MCNVLFVIFEMQKIDGFLAVLNITGGNFSPHPQKLPFAVTSVDGDNYLLYYSSIDLGGNNLSSNKCKGPKMKRSLSIGDSQADKSRLRIPMKGRIQLVLFFFFGFFPFSPKKKRVSLNNYMLFSLLN